MVIKEKNTYEVTTNTGVPYTSRASTSERTAWKSIWDKNLNLISFKENNLDELSTLENKSDENYRRAVKNKNIHLKLLNEFLGIKEKGIPKIKCKKKIIWVSHRYSVDYNIMQIGEYQEFPKTFDRMNKDSMQFVESTEEKEKLSKEYILKYYEFIKYRDEIFDKLFGKRK